MGVGNYIERENPAGLKSPPDWWLARLRDFDHMLVLFPSAMPVPKDVAYTGKYILARRRLYSAGLGDVAMLDNKHPDTNFCYAHALVPLNMPLTVKGTNPWTENSIADVLDFLRSRDTWRYTGGGDATGEKQYAADDQLAKVEAVEVRKERVTFKDNIRHRAKDAWRSLLARVGSRNKRASEYHGVARPRPASSGTAH